MVDEEDARKEVDNKESRARELMAERGVDALLLRQVSSFAWATAGSPSYVNTAVDRGEAAVLYTREGRFAFTNDIEAQRLRDEGNLERRGFTLVVSPWVAGSSSALSEATRGLTLASDSPGPGEIDLRIPVGRMRAALCETEVQRFRNLCTLCGEAMGEAISLTTPGSSEHEIAAGVSQALVRRGVTPIVLQVAVDARIFAYRHALPTDASLSSYAMLSFCGRRDGLVCSLTRLVHFGSLSAELARKEEAVARVDASLLRASVPGTGLRDLFDVAVRAYASNGYDGEWRHHHQGGVVGYEPREILATPTSEEVVAANHVVAWNPTIQGTKSEDTALVTQAGAEVLTEMPGWPVFELEEAGQIVRRPRILVVQ